jgi:steroid delta-isomerase-like uncharacterized protein
MPHQTLMHQWFEEVWNRGDEGAIDRMFAADGVVHGLSGAEDLQPEAFKSLYRQLRGAFPDIRIEVEDTVREGDKLVARCTVRGTHTGDGLGMPPTGRPVEISGMAFVHVRDGQIAEAWNIFDFQALTAQLTAPDPAGAG